MAQWFAGAQHLGAFLGQPFIFAPQTDAARYKGVVTRAAGCPAVALFRRAGPDSPWVPDGLHLLEIEGDRVARVVAYVTPKRHPAFGFTAPL